MNLNAGHKSVMSSSLLLRRLARPCPQTLLRGFAAVPKAAALDRDDQEDQGEISSSARAKALDQALKEINGGC